VAQARRSTHPSQAGLEARCTLVQRTVSLGLRRTLHRLSAACVVGLDAPLCTSRRSAGLGLPITAPVFRRGTDFRHEPPRPTTSEIRISNPPSCDGAGPAFRTAVPLGSGVHLEPGRTFRHARPGSLAIGAFGTDGPHFRGLHACRRAGYSAFSTQPTRFWRAARRRVSADHSLYGSNRGSITLWTMTGATSWPAVAAPRHPLLLPRLVGGPAAAGR